MGESAPSRYGAVILCLLAQGNAPDASDLLARGRQLTATKSAEAVKLLEQAMRVLARHGKGDEADAEAEFREAAARTPDSAAVHNYPRLFNLATRKLYWKSFGI